MQIFTSLQNISSLSPPPYILTLNQGVMWPMWDPRAIFDVQNGPANPFYVQNIQHDK
jgi:hypothetical protein